MKEINNFKDYFYLENINQPKNPKNSSNFSPSSLELQNFTPTKFKENSTNRNQNPAKNIYNNINEKININKSPKDTFISESEKINSQLDEINKKIISNLNTIQVLKTEFNKLKIEKNNKKTEIVNLLSNRESVDEIYKNYIEYIKSKIHSNKKSKKKNKKEIKNPFENQDEDTFEILIDEIKQIDINKFIEQSLNLLEDIFENPKKQLKFQLKEIVNKSFSMFNNEISLSNFIDTYSVVSNFFLRISIFLSNQSFGKYSETMINLLLRCLVKINSINVKNEELISYMNGQYKNEKNKLKEEINKLVLDNENLNNNKNLLEKKIHELNIINNGNNEINEENDLKNVLNMNNKGRNNLKKKTIFKEKLKDKAKKIYQEDLDCKNSIDEYYYFTENNKSEKIKNYNLNQFIKLNEFISSTEKRKSNNFEIDQRTSFKISDKPNEDSNDFKKYNTINFNEKNEISSTQNFQYTSPQINKKKQFYYKPNNNLNTSEHGLSRILSNEKKKSKEKKKMLNFKYNKNKIITYNDIKKNMKFDLAKKIKYLDKVNKNGMISLSKTSIQNKKNKLIYEKELKMKRLFTTEKKEKVVKYNFFDIIQETNKLRNSSGDNGYKTKNKLFDIYNIGNNNPLLRSSHGIKINGKYDMSRNIYIINNKKLENLIKSDFIHNKKKAFFDQSQNIIRINSSNFKNKKNGAEKKENLSNESDVSLQKNKLNKKTMNGGTVNKNIKKYGKNLLELNQNNKDKIKKKIVIISNNGKMKKSLKKNNIYHIISETKSKMNNSNNNLLKNDNFNSFEQNIKSNRSDYNKNTTYSIQPISIQERLTLMKNK